VQTAHALMRWALAVPFLRSNLASLPAAAVFYALYVPLTYCDRSQYITWVWAATVPTVIINFFCQKYWGFNKAKSGRGKKEFTIFFCFETTISFTENFLLPAIVEPLHTHPIYTQYALGVIGAFIGYLGTKLIFTRL
jgi:putative flippase GtrA